MVSGKTLPPPKNHFKFATFGLPAKLA